MKRFILLAFLMFLALSPAVHAANQLAPEPVFQALDGNGDPYAGGYLYTYASGTTTPLATYDEDGNANANPIVLDSAGRADIWLPPNTLYRFKLTDSDGTVIYTRDNIRSIEEVYIGDSFYYPDYSAADQGVTGSSNTIKYYVDTIGTTNKATIYLRHNSGSEFTDYTFLTAETIPANITLTFERGARISPNNAAVTVNAYFDSKIQHIFYCLGTGSVDLKNSNVEEVNPQMWGASASATAATNSAAFQAMLTAVGTYPSIPIYIPGVSVDSVGAYQINVALTKTSSDWIRIRGDGSSSWLQWTGADYATILSLTGAGSGNAVIEGVRFDCNDKATTGLQLAGFGEIVKVHNNEFDNGLANVADDQGMLNIPVSGETHNVSIKHNKFITGTAIGIGLGLTGASSAGSGYEVNHNYFQQIDNIAVKGSGLKESEFSFNIIDQLLTNTNGAGFYLDISSNLVIIGNHMESCANEFINLNPTGRYTFKPTTATIIGNEMISGTKYVALGYTDNVLLQNNTSLGAGATPWLVVSANAAGTRVGKNVFSSDLLGNMSWSEQYITATGFVDKMNTIIPVFSTTAVLTLTNQSSSSDWVQLTPISTTTEPDIPVDARGWVVQAMIKSATVGARLYMWSAGSALILWANRATDIRTQYIEAQTANRYNTANFIISAVNQSYEDMIYYGIDGTGVGDTDVELRIIGYLMPN